jgi:hypothetical protein
MKDLLYIGLTLVLWLASVGIIAGFERLMEERA